MLRSLLLLLSLASCVEASSPDASVEDAPLHIDLGQRLDLGQDSGPMGVDACVRWEGCAGQTCVGGTVHPIMNPYDPCATACALGAPIHACALGCVVDGGFAESDVDPRYLCEEDRPRDAGEPCESDAGCGLPSMEYGDGGLVYHRLACDPDAGVCVDVPPPMPADFGASCGVDLSGLASAYGAVGDPSCSGGYCTFGAGCGACTIACAFDWDCPDGTRCASMHDWSERDAGTSTMISLCRTACSP